MRKVPVLSALDAAALIPDESVVSVSSSSALGCPDFVLKGIGERFTETGSPRNLTTVHPIAAGDMYGVAGVDHVAVPGLLRRIIAGSYPSGPSSAEPPLIWQLIEQDAIEAYNLPSGVLFQMHRAGATGQPGVLTEVGLDTFADPRHDGGRMNDRTTGDLVEVEERDGKEWLFYPAVRPDVAIIRATTADEWGNLTFEDEGSTLGALDQAYAAHNHGGIVIAQVKRLAAGGSLPPQQVRVPGILVDALVIHEDQLQTTQTAYDPAISGQIRRPLDVIGPAPWGVEKVIARRAAAELAPDEIVNLGFGISALVPRILVEQGHADAVTWVIEQGAVGGTPLTGFAFGCALDPQALMPSIDQFTLLQGGGFDQALLSFLEIDEQGSVNVHHLPGRRHVTAGVGGFADITSHAKSIVFSGNFTAGRREISAEDGRLVIARDGTVPKLVERVSAVTFSGPRALANGQQVRYVTERCVLELRPEGMTVIEVAPGADLQRDVLDQAAGKLRVADDVREMDSHLFRPEPLPTIFRKD
ncbi:acyl CoA:acetate/3-ketoacid CoA transferase [Amycolatopsis jejuensis]|uniref:acyl CoA:acetate/3-ketoacid CoA transferase n=1 Tax=Amycolatopsis jejuensis TaxID=330084 RepID=UPI000524712F|nr:CoA-transferase [Amycolatopsis jejuensis]